MSYEVVIRLTVPDGTTVRLDDEPIPASFVPPFEDELIPLPPEAIPVQGDVPQAIKGDAPWIDPAPFRAPQARQAETAPRLCPTHHEPWKLVPEGVSKKTGRPYSAFYACPVRGCDQRPAA